MSRFAVSNAERLLACSILAQGHLFYSEDAYALQPSVSQSTPRHTSHHALIPTSQYLHDESSQGGGGAATHVLQSAASVLEGVSVRSAAWYIGFASRLVPMMRSFTVLCLLDFSSACHKDWRSSSHDTAVKQSTCVVSLRRRFGRPGRCSPRLSTLDPERVSAAGESAAQRRVLSLPGRARMRSRSVFMSRSRQADRAGSSCSHSLGSVDPAKR